MTHLLEVSGLTTGYGRLDVVHRATLSAPRGSVVAVLGPSGAGKTTTLRAIAGLLPVRSGSVRLDGERVDGLPPADIASRGLVLMPERESIFTTLTVEENLRLGHEARGGERDFADSRDLVTGVFPQLAELFARRAGTLSGGEQQMVALGRVLLTDPRVLLLDEISMGLAPKVVADIYGPVGRMRDRGVTIMLVEQQLERALELADICYVMVGGRIVFVAEPAELRDGATSISGYLGT